MDNLKKQLTVGGIFLALGLGLAGFGTHSYFESSDSESWPKVQGTVKTSEVRSYVSESNGSRRRSRSDRGLTVSVGNVSISNNNNGANRHGNLRYKADVVFEYELNGTKFMSDRVAYVDSSSSRVSDAQAIVSRYPTRAAVTVSYDPADPAFGLLEPGVSGAVYIFIGMGLMFTLLGAAICMKSHA